MGQNSSQIPEHELEHLSIESGLSRGGILKLYGRFISLATHRDKTTNEYFLTKGDFQSIAELKQNPLGDRIIDAFFADAEVDRCQFRVKYDVLGTWSLCTRFGVQTWCIIGASLDLRVIYSELSP